MHCFMEHNSLGILFHMWNGVEQGTCFSFDRGLMRGEEHSDEPYERSAEHDAANP